MPLFEFRCPACDSQFELLIRGAAVPTCPSCGNTSLEKLLSMFAVSSADSQQRNRKTLGTQQRAKAQGERQEQTHYAHDHHDD